MSILYLALGIYVFGVAVVLYLRPHLMFHPETGSWKEFGIDTTYRSTVFPFWMFAIIWAFVSYALATILYVTLAQVSIGASPSMNEPIYYEESVAMPISKTVGNYTPMQPSAFLPTRMHVDTPRPAFVQASETPSFSVSSVSGPSSSASGPSLSGRIPGYYIVEPQPSGVPQFVYFGTEPPTYANLAAYAR